MWRTADWSITFNEKINKNSLWFGAILHGMSRMRRHFHMNVNERQTFHMIIFVPLYAGGLKSIGLPLLFKWQQHTWADTHTFAPHTHTLPPAVFTVSWVEEMPTAKNQWLHFLFFFPSSSPLSHSHFFLSPFSGKTHNFISSCKWSWKVIIIKPTWF